MMLLLMIMVAQEATRGVEIELDPIVRARTGDHAPARVVSFKMVARG